MQRNRNTQKRQKNNNKKSGKPVRDGIPAKDLNKILEGQSTIIRGPMLDNVVVELRYQDPSLSRSNVGNAICSWRYRMNSTFDPDPLLGTGAISGFNEWAGIYSTYRVIGFRYEIEISNAEAFPIVVTTCPTTSDLGANATAALDFSEVPYGKQAMLSAKGGQDRAFISGSLYLPKFFGASYLYDSTFNSLTTGNPGTLLFFNVGCVSGTAQTVGTISSVKLTYITSFYRRYNVFF